MTIRCAPASRTASRGRHIAKDETVRRRPLFLVKMGGALVNDAQRTEELLEEPERRVVLARIGCH